MPRRVNRSRKQHPRKKKHPRRKSGSKPKRRSKGGPRNGGMLAMQICAATDPFCEAARDSKQQNKTSIRTVAYQIHGFATVFSDVNGIGATAFSANPFEGVKTATAFTGSVPTAWTTGTAYAGSINPTNAGCSYRVVTMGIQCISQLSSMNNAGVMGILVVPGGNFDNNVTIGTVSGADIASVQYSNNTRCALNNTRGLAGIANSDGFTSCQFRNPVAVALTTTTIQSWGNDVLVAYVAGAPASAVPVQVEYFINYELVFDGSSFFNSIATPSAPLNPVVENGSNFVRSTLSQVILGGKEEVERQVVSRAKSFAARAIGGLLGYAFGGPAGASVGHAAGGMIMNVD